MSLLHVTAAIAISLGVVPNDDVVTDNVDLVEINHYYDDNARHIFDQLIFYDWCERERRFQVRAWRLIRDPAQLPTRNWSLGGYDLLWNDGEFMRHVHAKAMHETWTQHDPEMRERDYLPKEHRRQLVVPRTASTSAVP